MEITDVRVRKTYPEGKMRAIVSVTFDDQFVVHDIKVIEGQSGFFIAMPSRKTPDGEFKDIAHPINMGTRRQMQESVLKAYDLAVEQEESNSIEEADVELEVDYEEE
ncbi:MAG: stage sporulation protein [Eubacteriaceae bacterium]|jgi:stage V sporulation protein G|nr:stage sporulation protein [Eubacteriaceae bacterium]MDK2936340.1 stage sporulation protein [Eubacteriaceae bacterium]MDN5308564.1 stage sporulation protein [Eubacteriaceae bacterium]